MGKKEDNERKRKKTVAILSQDIGKMFLKRAKMGMLLSLLSSCLLVSSVSALSYVSSATVELEWSVYKPNEQRYK